MMLHRAWLLVGLVLLVHAGVLGLIKSQWQPAAALAPMAEPLFLHLISPKPPPPTKLASAKNLRHKPPSLAKANPQQAGAAPLVAETATRLPEDAPMEPAASAAPLDTPGATDTARASDTPPQPPMREAISEVPNADSWPPDTRVSYRMRGYYRGDLYGSAKVQWQRQAQRYQVQLDVRMALLFQVSMTSQGKLTEAGLVPQAYEERFLSVRRGVSFDAEQLRLQDGRLVTKPVGVQDTASQFVTLSQRFSSARQALAVGEVVSVWLARPGGVDLWTYDVTESVSLQTPELGMVQAFHLKPRPLANPRGDIVAELWLAPSLQYLPVRVRIALGGDNFVDLMVETIEQGGAPAEPQGNGNSSNGR